MFINNPGHMTKMAAMPIYGKTPSKFFFSRTTGPISTKLDMKHRGLEYYNVYINYDRLANQSQILYEASMGRGNQFVYK